MAQGISPRKRVVIVGGGFGGLAAARALRHARAWVMLIDRSNHDLFQPLLCQVATSVLSPRQIGWPIREMFKRQPNATVVMGEVTGVDKERRRVFVTSLDRRDVPVEYDYLVMATGVRHSYFGHQEFERFAPGLKTLADAVAIRNRILTAFEQAEAEEDPTHHRDLLTFVFVGAGPTGVELAAALAVMIRSTLKSEFRRIDPRSARIILVDMADRVLGAFSSILSAAALRRLQSLGVEVMLGHGAEQIDESGSVVDGQRIAARTVIWTAGVESSQAGRWLAAETDRAGRVRVETDLTVPGYPEIYVIGDIACLEQDGKALPGLAPVALQQGLYAGKAIERRLRGMPPGAPFRYFNRGSMAVVGKGFAILQSGRVQLTGWIAWLISSAVHLQYLAQTNLRLSVFVQWVWTQITGQRGSRLIVWHHENRSESISQATASAIAQSNRGDFEKQMKA
jgi:NADH dehydrogenase